MAWEREKRHEDIPQVKMFNPNVRVQHFSLRDFFMSIKINIRTYLDLLDLNLSFSTSRQNIVEYGYALYSSIKKICKVHTSLSKRKVEFIMKRRIGKTRRRRECVKKGEAKDETFQKSI